MFKKIVSWFSSSLTRKLVIGCFSLSLVLILFLGTWFKHVYRERILTDIRTELTAAASLLASRFASSFESTPTEALQKTVLQMSSLSQNRITLISPDGVVLADSMENPNRMENHRSRPEVVGAIAHGQGEGFRLSGTVHQEMMYFAQAIRLDGKLKGIVRVAVPSSRITQGLATIYWGMLWSALVGLLVTILVSYFLVRTIAKPVDEMISKRTAEVHILERARHDFVANASHELKTPLTAVKGYVDSLIEGAWQDSEVRERFLSQLAANVDRLVALAEDLLTLSRIESQKDEVQLNSMACTPIIEESIKRYRPVAENKGLHFSFSPELIESTKISTSSQALLQIVDNLVDNAVKYTPAGGEVDVALREGPSAVILEVKDSGVGIPPEDLSRIFERFYRVDKARSVAAGGTGLGLSIVKHLATQIHATIHVESQLGKGSTFKVELPRAV